MAGRLEGKVAVVTGGGSGIGAATVEAFHAEGAKVLVADISGLQDQVAEKCGDGVVATRADVSESADVQAMLKAAVDEFGKLDIIHNNAGIDGEVAPTGEMTEEQFDQVWAINGRGVWLGMRYGIPILLAGGGGSIINTASMASMVAFPGMNGYCAAKGAVLMMTRTAAAEYAGQGIRVNAICPGAIRTAITDSLPPELIKGVVDATPVGRFADPSEVASLAVYLASDESRFVTGAGMLIDGGYTLV
ncbi:MAG TPA: glucose 1-dehydrogenase [Solirubrobacteraceae bacterium]|jgi:NAD(P)-dependent dehydrogenase (short-subunit alcohol dehydrogenase family)|nr:glucose 1-dehydrogenase [Solirubrobacteraceae bacterium]